MNQPTFLDAMGLVLARNFLPLCAFFLITVFNLRMCFALVKHGKRMDAEEKRKRERERERERIAGGGA